MTLPLTATSSSPELEPPAKSDVGHRWALSFLQKSRRLEWGNVRGSVMDANVARTRDFIGSVLLFASAILIIFAFGFL